MLGGAEAQTVDERFCILEAKGNESAKEFYSKLAEVTNNLNKLTEQFNEMKTVIESMREQTVEFKKVCDIAVRNTGAKDFKIRLDDLERMQKYFQTSHGKALNDISDLKKELYNLYGRQCPPPEEELNRSSEPVAKDTDLKELVMELKLPKITTDKVIQQCGLAGLDTLNDISRMSFDELCDLSPVDPAVASILCQIREKYCTVGDDEPIIREDIPEYDIRDVIKAQNCSMKQKTTVINKLYKDFGVNTLRDLSEYKLAEFEKTPRFGKGSIGMLRNIYRSYIWA